MGNFKQHVTCSTVTGIALGGIGYYFNLPLPTCLLSAGLCGMAGMLPDIDSDTSRSFQECIYLAAGIAAVLTVQRLREFGVENDIIMLGGAFMFLFVRFGVGEFVKKITSHRGMFHSIPAAIFSGQIVFFLSTGTVEERVFKAAALSIGYLSHLILDEICSIDSNGRLKKSSGTALKFYDGKRLYGTLALYSLIFCLGIVAVNDPKIDRSTVQQFASEKLRPNIREKISEIKSELKEPNTTIQQEAAKYLARAEAAPTESEIKSPVSIREATNEDWDSERRLFSRHRRRASPIPVDTTESEIVPVRIASLPILPPLPLPPEPQQPPQYGSMPTPSPIPISHDTIPDTVFERHDNYRHFALPNREPAPVVLP